MPIRLAVVVSHPIQYFAPWYREIAKRGNIEQKVFFCSNWGAESYIDPQFKAMVKWDIPLLDGYSYEFLPMKRQPSAMNFWQVDNPAVSASLDAFNPDVLMLFGYNHRTNWRALAWAKRNAKPVLLYSDSSVTTPVRWHRRAIKELVVKWVYSQVDGAFYVGKNNYEYHIRFGGSHLRTYPGVLPVERERLLAAVPDRAKARREIRQKFGIPQDGFVVMFCGKFVAHKRVLDVVTAGNILTQRRLPVWTLLVGEGPERPAIEGFCREHDSKQNILTGFVNQSRIPEYYAAADVLALPSSTEPYGLVASEAIGFGLPLIVSDRVGCIGLNDTARPGCNAIVYPCGEVDRLAAAIELLYRDSGLYRQMSEASAAISVSQDVVEAAHRLELAVHQLYHLGPRRRTLAAKTAEM